MFFKVYSKANFVDFLIFFKVYSKADFVFLVFFKVFSKADFLDFLIFFKAYPEVDFVNFFKFIKNLLFLSIKVNVLRSWQYPL